MLVNTDSVKCALLKAFPSCDNFQKIFLALVTFYSKFPGYFSNLDFHVTNEDVTKNN